jgi:hypothetical protein
MENIVINLIVENAKAGEVWGRVNYEDDLLIESAENVEQLQIKMKALILDFHDLKPDTINFEISYDLSAFFENFAYLKISEIAKYAGLNASLLRHYVAGSKTASKAQVMKLQKAIRKVGIELMQVNFA